MANLSKSFLELILLLILAFVILNMLTDLRDYFNTKQLGILDEIFKNNIII